VPLARRFGVNPTWTFKAFDADSQATTRDLYAIFFDGGLVTKAPDISMTLACSRRTFQFDMLAQAKGLGRFPLPRSGCTPYWARTSRSAR
jgi:hypothetical protein